jgi:exopolysaccharide biosynthesis protein
MNKPLISAFALAAAFLSAAAPAPVRAQGTPLAALNNPISNAVQHLAQGVVHYQLMRKTAAGPMAINVLRVNSRQVSIRSLIATRTGGGFGRAPVTAIAKAYGAIAAINGSYFNLVNSEPAGLLVMDGQIVSSTPFNRSVFGIRYDGTPFIDDAHVRASVLLESGREVLIQRVNHQAKPGELTLYTPHWGHSTKTAIQPYRYEAAIDANGTVIEVSNGDLPIPKGGYVVSGQGASYHALSAALQPGTKALVYTQLKGVWEGVRYAVGGGPTIVHQGKVHVTAKQECVPGVIACGRAPRTAIGYNSYGETLMITVDGRKKDHSVGCTLNELGRIMVELGALEAINLDGGGSSTMVVNGKAVNQVSAGSERFVSNAIGVFVHD